MPQHPPKAKRASITQSNPSGSYSGGVSKDLLKSASVGAAPPTASSYADRHELQQLAHCALAEVSPIMLIPINIMAINKVIVVFFISFYLLFS
jgi:hypothetical protein